MSEPAPPSSLLRRGQVLVDRDAVVQPQDHHLVDFTAAVVQLHRHAACGDDLAVDVERVVGGVDLQRGCGRCGVSFETSGVAATLVPPPHADVARAMATTAPASDDEVDAASGGGHA